MILGASFLNWIAQLAMCVTRQWPDCNAPCWQPCFPGNEPSLWPEELRLYAPPAEPVVRDAP